MKQTALEFSSRGEVYKPDTCAALRAAAEQGLVSFRGMARGRYLGARLPSSWLPGLRNVGYWDAPEPQNWGLDWHRNEGIEFTCLSSGRTPFSVDDHATTLEAGRMAITRPWQRHRVGNPNIGAGRLNWLILDVGVRRPNQAWRWPAWVMLTKDDRDRLTQLLRHNEQPVWSATPAIFRCFEELGKAVDHPKEATCQSRLLVHINELLLAVLELLGERDIPLDPQLSSSCRAVELFLEELSTNPDRLSLPWTVSMMAQDCGLGVTAFTKYCRQLVNLSPMQYTNRCRVRCAAKLLIDAPNMTITDVAAACGFSTSQYFATVFRQQRGCSPASYREGDETVHGPVREP